ncbi:hypothetical protein KZX45_08600 [Georgenia sp. EYE_87]|jgi:hypothetical protein|uniref:hypothetical protein n=1 Tax=Georgenia sp. EYE_87 TaxID=2853448 RepID=UPI0020052F60|nr:hypothetical protein [Georgenia sp. EYE_87]MCK6210599.1 hypothetical protein [Georgenia sp. EYE_87]
MNRETPRETADRAKELADAAAENLEHTRPDDEDLAEADVDAANRPGVPDNQERLDPEGPGEDLVGPGSPMP